MRHLSVRQIATQAGVSSTTVFHLLHRSRYVCPETTRKIVEGIRTLGGDPAALGIRGSTVAARELERFGLLVPDLSNPFFCELMVGFEKSAARLGYEIVLRHSNGSQSRLRAATGQLMEEEVAGIAVMTADVDGEFVNRLRCERYPSVFLDLEAHGEFLATVDLDYEAGVASAVQYLFGLGHRRIAYLGGPSEFVTVERRRRAYRDEMARLGLEPRIAFGDLTMQGGMEATLRLLQSGERPTALIAVNDLSAMGAVCAARQAGVTVPEQISVVGFDNIEWARFYRPGLTTLSVAPAELGALAAIALHRILISPEHAGLRYRVCPKLMVRESTAAAGMPAGEKQDAMLSVAG